MSLIQPTTNWQKLERLYAFQRPELEALPAQDEPEMGDFELPTSEPQDRVEFAGRHQGQAYLQALRQALVQPPTRTAVEEVAPLRNVQRLLGSSVLEQPTPPPVPVPPTPKVTPLQVNPGDWHIPRLEEVFRLAQDYPGKQVILDCKLPKANAAVSQRMARQIMELCDKYPEMKNRIIVMSPDAADLQSMKAEFAKHPAWKDFKNFTLDDDKLNDFGTTAADRSPLTGSGDNRYVSIGKDRNPLNGNNFDTLVDEVGKARKTIDAAPAGSPDHGKKILVWTLNDQDEIRKIVKAGADGILTDDPDSMKRTLDQMGYGPAGQDPKRPKVFAHRGGPNSTNYPENTLPAIEQGFRRGDAIEIDIVSARDGVAVFHDNDPTSFVGLIRNLGAEGGNSWRPVYPDLLGDLGGKRLDELTVDEIQKNYGFERNATGSPVANLLLGLGSTAMRLPGAWLRGMSKVLHIGDFKPLEWAASATDWAVDQVGRPIARGAVQALDKVLTGAWQGVTQAGEGLWNGLQDLGHGRILKGLGEMVGGVAGGAWTVVKGVAEGAWSAVKGVAQGVTNVVEGIGKGISKVAKSVGKFFKGLFG